MNDCCNPNCNGVSKMIRCGDCRRHKEYYCAAGCDTEVKRHFKVFCDECAEFSYHRSQLADQLLYREKNREIIRYKQRKRRLENAHLL